MNISHNSVEKRFQQVSSSFKDFIDTQEVSSLLLLSATIMALVLSNSSLAPGYNEIIHTHISMEIGSVSISKSIQHWINELLMTFFFFVIGLEIKREVLVGELSLPGRKSTVIMAALGGMLVPAGVFYLINLGHSETLPGWGIPMATDTAFIIGILALIRRMIPVGIFSFITALAIIDDIGAILVIALFYTQDINIEFIIYAGLSLSFIISLNILGVRHPLPYLITAMVLWLCTLESGIHATVAGILAAMAIPARPKHGPTWFIQKCRRLIDRFEKQKEKEGEILSSQRQHDIIEDIYTASEEVTTPLQRWENASHKPIGLFILPIFALANANINLSFQSMADYLVMSVTWGIIGGLILGKFVGITFMTWLCLKLRLGSLGDDVRIAHVAGVGLLAGMGFTMSLFIANMAFTPDSLLLPAAKFAILLSSLLSGCLGFLCLFYIGKTSSSNHRAETLPRPNDTQD